MPVKPGRRNGNRLMLTADEALELVAIVDRSTLTASQVSLVDHLEAMARRTAALNDAHRFVAACEPEDERPF